MKKIALILFVFCSCSKANNAPSLGDSITGHYWICDSVKTTQSGSSQTVIVGQGTGLDLEFFNNGTYTVYTNPPLIKNYVQRTDSLYYWTAGNPMDQNSYMILKTMASQKMHLWQKDQVQNKQIDSYYHFQ